MTTIAKLKICKNNAEAVRALLDDTEGIGKGGAIRWAEVVIELLEDVIKELNSK